MTELSTKPYMLRAIYEWCTDSGYTPHMAVKVNGATQVPMAFVKNGEIVLNISFGATSGLKMDNESIRFNARFGGVSREIFVPIENVLAIYANENGQGMAFEVTLPTIASSSTPNIERLSDMKAERSGIPESSGGASLTAVPSSQGNSDVSSQVLQGDQPESPKKSGKPTLTRIK
jgi:stringent starvation protein B